MFAVLRSTIRTASLGSDTVPCRPIASFGSSLPSLSATPHGRRYLRQGDPLAGRNRWCSFAPISPTRPTNSWLDRSARLR